MPSSFDSGAPGFRAPEQADCKLIERSGLFDRAWYLEQYPDVVRSGVDPILDYVRCGAGEGRNPNLFFEYEWYVARYPDVQSAGAKPLVHYYLHGAAEGRNPGPFFDTQWYLARHPVVAAKGINPLAHYLQEGWNKGALPFDPARLLAGIKVAVIVHLFYADLWREIASWLRNVPIDFDLFVSVPREKADTLRAIVLRDHPRAQVVEVRNAGRDVGAFFAILPSVLAGNYTVLCKLHSKKGAEYADAWRDLLLRGALANKMLVTRILHAFACDPELALAGAREVYLSGTSQIQENREKVREITRLLYPKRSIPEKWGFFAGTMFWARPDFLRPLTRYAQDMFSFETDNTRSDGQLAHALERVFGAAATLEGKRIALTQITGLGPLDGSIYVTEAPGEPWEHSFARVLRGHALRLNGALPFAAYLEPRARTGPRTSVRARIAIERFGIPAFTAKWHRRASASFPRLSRHALRALKLAWWTVTLQIVSRLGDVRARRLDAKLIASSHLFDRDWYLEHYPDVRAADVDPALHYLVQGAAEYRDPSPRFDTAWYLAFYPEVAAAGVNPLADYLRHGAQEGRHARPADILFGKVADAALSCRKHPRAGGEIALFVTHSPDGRLKPHVRHYLEALQRHGIRLVLIVAADLPFREVEEPLLVLLDGLYIRENIGYDFAAWAHVLRENPQLYSADILYLVNDSMLGPLNEQKFAAMLQKLRSSKSDVIGLTDSYERGWHIQSYFIALKSAALSSAALLTFIEKIKNVADKRYVVNAYEVRLAPTLQAAGLHCEVLFPSNKTYNPSLLDWHSLIRSGLPFVKVAVVRDSSRGFDNRNWRKILQSEGFDEQLVEQALLS
jgi:lipopolysaccharide biosynthesis protein